MSNLGKELRDGGFRSSSVDARKVINNSGDSITKVGDAHYIYNGSHVYDDSALKHSLKK